MNKQEKKEEETSVLQEDLVTDDLRNRYNGKIGTYSKYYAEQSKSVSENSRRIVWVIIGTVWVLCFKQDTFVFPNVLIILSAVFSFVFLAIDLIHYFFDSCFYYRRAKSLRDHDIEEEYLQRQIGISEYHEETSFIFLVLKFVFVIITTILFVIGLICLVV